MDGLPHHLLTTLSLAVDFRSVVRIGETAAGHRGIVPITGGSFAGPRLNGDVLPGGSDWFVTRPDGSLAIDVRLTLRTQDGAHIYLSYAGYFLASPATMARFRAGEQLSHDEYALHAIARFECGDPRYAWLNDTLAVAVGEQTLAGPIYTISAIGPSPRAPGEGA